MVIKLYSGTYTPKPRFFILFEYSEWSKSHRVFSLYMHDYTERLIAQHEYHWEIQHRDYVKDCRKLWQYAKQKDVATRSRLTVRHNSDKLLMMDVCRGTRGGIHINVSVSKSKINHATPTPTRKQRWGCQYCNKLVYLIHSDVCPKETGKEASKCNTITTITLNRQKGNN